MARALGTWLFTRLVFIVVMGTSEETKSCMSTSGAGCSGTVVGVRKMPVGVAAPFLLWAIAIWVAVWRVGLLTGRFDTFWRACKNTPITANSPSRRTAPATLKAI